MGYLEDVMYAAEQTVVQDSLSVTLILFLFFRNGNLRKIGHICVNKIKPSHPGVVPLKMRTRFSEGRHDLGTLAENRL